MTGTVLSFEFGLLWPAFTGRFGDVFGILFAIEGIFFFLEAIFIAIYIFGWDRLSGWAHFWTGVPIVICGIGGAYSVVSVNAWMNQPQGYTLDAAGNVSDIDPLKVIFDPAVPLRGPAHDPRRLPGHVLPRRLGLRGRNAPGPPRPPPPARLADPADRGCILAPIQFMVGDTAAGRSPRTSRSSSRPWSASSTLTGTSPSTSADDCTEDGIKGGSGSPGLDSWLVGFSTDTEVTGLDTVPAKDRPPANTLLHLSFDRWSGWTAMIALGVWFGIMWWRKRDIPKTPWFLRAVGDLRRGHDPRDGGRLDRHRGRPPAVDRPGSDADRGRVTGASGVWVTFSIVLVLYAALGTATVLILRRMARRWREEGEDSVGVPYGPPSEPPEETA